MRVLSVGGVIVRISYHTALSYHVCGNRWDMCSVIVTLSSSPPPPPWPPSPPLLLLLLLRLLRLFRLLRII
eukprot:7538596-Pyramimonas_sp.AAC.1